jgi:hypothetical protein
MAVLWEILCWVECLLDDLYSSYAQVCARLSVISEPNLRLCRIILGY